MLQFYAPTRHYPERDGRCDRPSARGSDAAGFARTIDNPELNWLYKCEPDPGYIDRPQNWARLSSAD